MKKADIVPYKQIDLLLNQDLAVYGDDGGMLLGPSHNEGGIFALTDVGIGYQAIAEWEGYEYVVNVGATIALQSNDLIKVYNDRERDLKEPFFEYPLDGTIRTIDARLPAGHPVRSKFVIMKTRGPFLIVNRHSAKVFLEDINGYNLDMSYRYNNEDFLKATSMDIISTASEAVLGTLPLTALR